MKKAEIKLMCQALVESGKILALASLMGEKSKPREAAERVANQQIDDIAKQFELFAEDADFRKETKQHAES